MRDTCKTVLVIGLISVAIFTLANIWNDLNTSFFMGLIFNDAKEFAAEGTITSNFMPIGYSSFLGTCVAIGGVSGIPACQAFAYAGVLFGAFLFLRLRGAGNISLLVGALAIALHPILVINVWRIHDGNLTTFLLIGFLVSGLWCLKSKSWWSTLLFGVITGLMLTVRVNTILLVLPAFLLFYKQETKKLPNVVKRSVLFFAGTAMVFMAVNMAIKQTPLFVPNHGFYNLFSGANEYSAKYLLKDFSGENSHAEALEAKGFFGAEAFEERISFPSEMYKKLALEYIKEHPVEYLKLTGIKVITLFRPGYHVPENFEWFSAEGVKRTSKIILAAPFFVWLFFVWKTRKEFFEKENLFVFLTAALYLLPFVMANADPRYRFPVDIIFILDFVRRWWQLSWNKGKIMV